MRFDPRHQFARAERLRHVVVAADFETQHAVHFIRPRRQKDHRRARERARLADCGGKDRTRPDPAASRRAESGPAATLRDRAACRPLPSKMRASKPAARQVVFDQRSQLGFIFDDGDFSGHTLAPALLGAARLAFRDKGRSGADDRTSRCRCYGRHSSRCASHSCRQARCSHHAVFGLYIWNGLPVGRFRAFSRGRRAVRAGAGGAGAPVAQILEAVGAVVAVFPVDLDAFRFGDGDVFGVGS